MSELEQYQEDVEKYGEGGLAKVEYVGQKMSPLVAYAQEVKAAGQIANTIGNTSFVPDHFRGKTPELASAILYGQDLGLPVMHSMRALYSIRGTPALYADAMLAVALNAGHEIERVEATEQVVKYRARRWNAKAREFGDWQEVVWSIDRATRAGYTKNPKYKTDPVGMLTAKAKSEAAKLVANDALNGLYSVEDMELEGSVDSLDKPVAPRKVVQRKKKDEVNADVDSGEDQPAAG